ncbi:gamma-glutamylcyclotransferase family protein [Pontiella agarivorans]|uniref:Putative gamma-glutamylcyclotransferase n=1 Tax=Pontiella agarivorans TaxID=3038953 RepID=A0ABU5MUZ4_9BACT|nr:gamma-glutamylcyclotransferase family protein [Pontiella agarivorans]MDZ8117982.1 gamma-glutamylcyclotransferase [Pontiella agarivorans]
MNLFTYGTLMWPEVLESVIGRRLTGTRAVLEGYIRLRVKGQHYPVAVRSPEDAVEGTLCTGLFPEELQCLDRFEGVEYDRVETDFDGTAAWVYVLSKDWKSIAAPTLWKPADLRPEHLAAFCAEYRGWGERSN